MGADKILIRQEPVQTRILSEFDSADVESLNSLIADRKESYRLRRWLAHFVVNSAPEKPGVS